VKYPCERCRGRGWDPPTRVDSFPDACAWCKGAGILRTFRLSRILKCSAGDLYRVERRIAGSAAGARVIDAIARYMPGVLSISTVAARLANLRIDGAL
jgi:predicted DNA-binding transcriptional regulator YafY